MMSDGAAAYREQTDTPFVDTSGDDPTVVNKRRGKCRGSSKNGGVCTAMSLEFDTIEQWREHRGLHHPVGCDHCDVLAAYKRDNSPGSVCYRHLPDDPDSVYKWRRTNTKSVIEPPKAEGHIIESVLPATDGDPDA
jgi:hypothetical protein